VQPSNFEDPQPKEIARIIDQVRERDVPVGLRLEVFPVQGARADREGDRRAVRDTLRDDDLPGGAGDAEHSWLGLMRYDYVTMIRASGYAKALEALDVLRRGPRPVHLPQ
jgi:hypothetical protein